MDVRSEAPDDDWADAPLAGRHKDDLSQQVDLSPDEGPLHAVCFLVPAWVIAVKFAVAGGIALLAAIAAQPAQTVVGLIVALGVAAYAGRDLIARERLRADAEGLAAVRGYAGRVQLRWDQVEQLRVDTRARLGANAATLEVDAGEHIFFFTRNDLGVEPEEALALLEKVRAG